MQAVISVEGLTKIYKGKEGHTEAVKGIDFEVYSGEIFGLLGPNGAGKTTTLEIIEGLKSQTSGSISVLGMDNLQQSDKVKEVLGVQLQASEYLPSLTLKELLQLFASFYGRKANADELLHFVGLEDKASAFVKQLSGGQKQRFSLASSLVNDPKLLILDEPTTGLDPKARRDVWDLIRKINSRSTTIVLTTHYMEEAETLCNRVAILDKGKILALDKPHTLIHNLSNTVQASFFPFHPVREVDFAGLGADVMKIYSTDPKVVMEIRSLEVIPKLLEFLDNSKIGHSGFTVRTASLEDVYLSLTGKEFDHA